MPANYLAYKKFRYFRKLPHELKIYICWLYLHTEYTQEKELDRGGSISSLVYGYQFSGPLHKSSKLYTRIGDSMVTFLGTPRIDSVIWAHETTLQKPRVIHDLMGICRTAREVAWKFWRRIAETEGRTTIIKIKI